MWGSARSFLRRATVAAAAPALLALAGAQVSMAAGASGSETAKAHAANGSGHSASARKGLKDALENDGRLSRAAQDVDSRKRIAAAMQNAVIMPGSASESLGQEICSELGIKLGNVKTGTFADGEVSVQLVDNVRGKDVYIVQSCSQPTNEHILELCLLISAARRASARSVTAVIPFFGYKRDVGTVSSLAHLVRNGLLLTAPGLTVMPTPDGADGEGGSGGGSGSGESAFLNGTAPVPAAAVPVSAADVAHMLETVGVDRIIAVDLQPPGQGQIEGFFSPRIPVENLRSTSLAVDFLARLKLNNPVVVAPNETCIQLAHDVRAGLQLRTNSYVGLAALVEAGPSRGIDRYAHRSPTTAADAPRSPDVRVEVVGDVYGADVILADDMIDSAKTLMSRLAVLKERGARRIVAFATHGLFNGGALSRINKSPLTDVIVTNTVPLRDDVNIMHTHKITQLSVAPLLAEAIVRVQSHESLMDLRVFDSGSAEPRYKGQE